MTLRPWRPPGIEQFANVGLQLDTGSGVLEEDIVVWAPSVRVIASEYAGVNLFDRLTSDVDYDKLQTEVDAFREIADLTNGSVLHEAGRIDLVRAEDRIYGSGVGLIMPSFAIRGHPSRFSDGRRGGTYYAAIDLDTAIAETQFHEEQTLRGSGPCITEKSVIEARLDTVLVDIRRGHAHPVGVYHLRDYRAGQAFGGMVRHLEGYGIVYDSVRHREGQCAAIFRPPALSEATVVGSLHYNWDGNTVRS